MIKTQYSDTAVLHSWVAAQSLEILLRRTSGTLGMLKQQ